MMRLIFTDTKLPEFPAAEYINPEVIRMWKRVVLSREIKDTSFILFVDVGTFASFQKSLVINGITELSPNDKPIKKGFEYCGLECEGYTFHVYTLLEKVRASDRLSAAIEEFGNEESSLTFDEKFSALREALTWNAWDRMRIVKKYGSKSPETEEHDYIQIHCMEQFKIMERMYNSQIKTNKMLGKSTEVIKTDFMRHVREMKSTIGDIIQKIPMNGQQHIQN